MTRFRFLIILPLLGGAAYVGVLIGDRLPPYVHDYGTITPAQPNEGDQVNVEWKMKKVNRICPGWIQRQIYDRDGALACNYDIQPAIRREQLYGQQTSGSPDRLSRSFTLCSRAIPGPAKYRAYTCYQCNWLQETFPTKLSICGYTPDVDFMIGPQQTAPMGPR